MNCCTWRQIETLLFRPRTLVTMLMNKAVKTIIILLYVAFCTMRQYRDRRKSDIGFKIRALAVWGQARYISVTEVTHNIESLRVIPKCRWPRKLHQLFPAWRPDLSQSQPTTTRPVPGLLQTSVQTMCYSRESMTSKVTPAVTSLENWPHIDWVRGHHLVTYTCLKTSNPI